MLLGLHLLDLRGLLDRIAVTQHAESALQHRQGVLSDDG